MPKYDKINKDARVIVEPRVFMYIRDCEREYEDKMCVSNDIVDEINRHVDNVRDVYIQDKYEYRYNYDCGDEVEGKTILELCENMAKHEDLIEGDCRKFVVTYLNSYGSEIRTIDWGIQELLNDVVNNEVTEIRGKFSDRIKALIKMATKLNDKQLNINLVEL